MRPGAAQPETKVIGYAWQTLKHLWTPKGHTNLSPARKHPPHKSGGQQYSGRQPCEERPPLGVMASLCIAGNEDHSCPCCTESALHVLQACKCTTVAHAALGVHCTCCRLASAPRSHRAYDSAANKLCWGSGTRRGWRRATLRWAVLGPREGINVCLLHAVPVADHSWYCRSRITRCKLA